MTTKKEKKIERFLHEIGKKSESQETTEKMVHPSIDTLINLEQGTLSEDEETKVYDHIALCDHCFQLSMNIRQRVEDYEKAQKHEDILQQLRELIHFIKEKIESSTLPGPTPSPFGFGKKISIQTLPIENLLEISGIEDPDLSYTLDCLKRALRRVEEDKISYNEFLDLINEEAERMNLDETMVRKVKNFVETVTS